LKWQWQHSLLPKPTVKGQIVKAWWLGGILINKRNKVMSKDLVLEIMNKWYAAMDKNNISVQPKASTILGTILADYKIKVKKSSKLNSEDLWETYMNTPASDLSKFVKSLSKEQKKQLEAQRQKIRDQYYAKRGLVDDQKTLLKG
jgi:hypothetical protein